jgi:glutamine amidotransferase
MIGIIDYGLGNVRAFANIFKGLAVPALIVRSAHDLAQVSKLIIPGVGAFDHAMQSLHDSGMRETLDEMVLQRQVPVLGVCVGMQMFACSSKEGVLPGLGWINADVKKFDRSINAKRLPVPHMGWNDVRPVKQSDLFKRLGEEARFYFLHSYYVDCRTAGDGVAVADYGGDFVCAMNHENIFGVQFHPEKSHQDGIQLLRNFAQL